jgi:hypothetical protein
VSHTHREQSTFTDSLHRGALARHFFGGRIQPVVAHLIESGQLTLDV